KRWNTLYVQDININTVDSYDGSLLIGSTSGKLEYANLTSTSESIHIENTANNIDLSVANTGFVSWDSWSVFYNDSVIGSFTLILGGSGIILGENITWLGNQTITGLLEATCYYLYIDSSGILNKTTSTVDLFKNNIVLFECFRDASLPVNNQISVKENHPADIDYNISGILHDVIGIIIHGSGANIGLNGTLKIQINGEAELCDHGLETIIPDSSAIGIFFDMLYLNSSNKWVTYKNTDTFENVYNNSGVITVLPSQKYVIYTLYVSKDDLNSSTPRYFAIIDNNYYISLVQCQNAITQGLNQQQSGNLAILELAQLGHVIFKTDIEYVNIAKATTNSSISQSGPISQLASVISTNTSNFNGILNSSDTNVQLALETIDNLVYVENLNTNTSNFDGILSPSDNTIQLALDTIDNLVYVENLNTNTSNFNGILSPSDDTIQKSLDTIDNLVYVENLNTNTSNFDGILSSADDTIQLALDTIDDHNTHENLNVDNMLNITDINDPSVGDDHNTCHFHNIAYLDLVNSYSTYFMNINTGLSFIDGSNIIYEENYYNGWRIVKDNSPNLSDKYTITNFTYESSMWRIYIAETMDSFLTYPPFIKHVTFYPPNYKNEIDINSNIVSINKKYEDETQLSKLLIRELQCSNINRTESRFWYMKSINPTSTVIDTVPRYLYFQTLVEDDSDSFYSDKRSVFTCRLTGLYHFIFSWRADPVTTNHYLSYTRIKIYNNITETDVHNNTVAHVNGNAQNNNNNIYYNMNNGDQMRFYVSMSAGISSESDDCLLQVFKVV
ncbi:MAG: hypothetical protein GQ557_02560, partial [Mycoplasmataceae bacterium]|nr:hypothetical protein [Mycoplasmataceae bacterium]